MSKLSIFSLFMYQLIFNFSVSASPFRQSVSDQEVIRHGLEVYENRCIGCHGVKGDGKGDAAKFLDPKPRDFTKGVYKFKSTPNEALPNDQDLMRTLTYGVPGTSMPSFSLLPEISKYAVIQYIKSFSDAWNDNENKMAKIQGRPYPVDDFRSHKKFIVRAKKGRTLYIENCLVCHGLKGHGDGEGAEGLSDDWDNPIRPANLTKPYIKSGRSVQDIYRVLLTGVAGTPMPSFKDSISDEELWDMAAFVLYLRGKKAGIYDELKEELIKPITKEEAGY